METVSHPPRTTQSLEVTRLVQSLLQGSEDTGKSIDVDYLQGLSHTLHHIRFLLSESGSLSGGKDEFRKIHGFETLIRILKKLSGICTISSFTPNLYRAFLDLCNALLAVLSEALYNHDVNRKCFNHGDSLDCGWIELQKALQGTGIVTAGCGLTHLFGLLFAFALREESLTAMFRTAGHRVASDFTTAGTNGSIAIFGETTSDPAEGLEAGLSCENLVDSRATLWNPEICCVIFYFWREIPRENTEALPYGRELASAVLRVLTKVSRLSKHNAVAMQYTGLATDAIEAFIQTTATGAESAALRDLCLELLKLGCNLDCVARLCKMAATSNDISTLLLEGLKVSREPAQFYFDLSVHGFASVELNDLRTPFLRKDGHGTYSFTTWLRVEEYDNSCHTTLFGAIDHTQTFFLLLYLDRKSHNLVLQTSIRSPRPSVRFKSAIFNENTWYHVVIMHFESTNSVSLYINGELSEQVNCEYPSSTLRKDGVSRLRTHYDSIHTFLGIPQDLSPRLGSGVLFSKWSLAASHLFSTVIPTEIVFLLFKLGPTYDGLLQGSNLGAFQTYVTSAAVSLSEEQKSIDRTDTSILYQTLRSGASSVIAEKDILLSLSAGTVKSVEDFVGMRSHSLRTSYTSESTLVAWNKAIPRSAEAAATSRGRAALTGGTVAYKPTPVASTCWRLCGSVPIALKLVALAADAKSLVIAVKVFFELIRDNWRNSEAVERENGYGLLAALLRSKLGFDATLGPSLFGSKLGDASKSFGEQIASDLLEIILSNVGLDKNQPKQAIMVNAMAYRILVVDCDIWRKSEPHAQRRFYEQFVIFGSTSLHRSFNAERLVRMRIIRKLIEAFKCDPIHPTTLPYITESMTTLLCLENNISTEILRSYALYITFALGTGDSPPQSDQLLPEGDVDKTNTSPDALPVSEVGTTILAAFTTFLCQDGSDAYIRKFARTVTNKWILHLLAADDSRVIIHASKVLARLLVSAGASYMNSFDEKTKGFIILRFRLRHWWCEQEVWSACFAIFFGIRVCVPGGPSLLDPQYFPSLLHKSEKALYCPSIWSVIMAMLEQGLTELPCRPIDQRGTDLKLLQSVIKLVLTLQDGSAVFREFLQSSKVSRELLKLLFVATASCTSIYNVHTVPEPMGIRINEHKTQKETHPETPKASKLAEIEICKLPSTSELEVSPPLHRDSSFVIVKSTTPHKPHTLRFVHPLAPKHFQSDYHSILEATLAREIMQVLVSSFVEQLRKSKDFSGLGLYLKAPTESDSLRAFVNSAVLAEIMKQLLSELASGSPSFRDWRVLTNIARFVLQACEAVFEGWLLNVNPLFDLVLSLLDHLQTIEVQEMKSSRQSSPVRSAFRTVFRRLFILRLFRAETLAQSQTEHEFLFTIPMQEALLLSMENDEPHRNAILYLLYRTIIYNQFESIQISALAVIQNLSEHKIMTNSTAIASTGNDAHVHELWNEHLSGKTEPVAQIRERCQQYESRLSDNALAGVIGGENNASQKSALARERRRVEKLEQSHLEDLANEHTWTEHHASTLTWNQNIYASEEHKLQRTRQDQQDNYLFLRQSFIKMENESADLLFLPSVAMYSMWSLDETEGLDRMRLRLIPIKDEKDRMYQSKREKQRSKSSAVEPTKESIKALLETSDPRGRSSSIDIGPTHGNAPSQPGQLQRVLSGAEEFEIVNNPPDHTEDAVEVNRKVMRSLQSGDQVAHVYNVSRIRGLEVFESLLIIGHNNLYLLEGLFQQSNNQVVNIWQAPEEERDPYIKMISGRETAPRKDSVFPLSGNDRRHWAWAQLSFISKRQFLFREVGIEIFFQDGRSYLILMSTPTVRNEIFAKLTYRTRGASERPREDTWRSEQFQSAKGLQQSVGERFATVFSFSSIPPETLRWMKGEITNFQYLNHVNSVAGRTTNDLTQYPVFPWILADYTSLELDLTNPRVYRDLTNPMGCQNRQRESAFRERYRILAELSDQENPPFHYGTHYSSAMIVSSYLIRLEPFVQSYLLLQGGSFDHADRLFDSIEKAWKSASGDNMTDVKELTPEFFYLPEFLTNVNGYNFGMREGSCEDINDVTLPPWAKGDPQIFINMQRKALESSYVSQRLHHWIDLIFGSKQRGEAAVESTNVFHHLSYPGKNLDAIVDPLEQRATAQVIHNFGQTPQQIFLKAHEQRYESSTNVPQSPLSSETLPSGPSIVYKSSSKIANLIYSSKHQRLLSNGPSQTYVPIDSSVMLDWSNNDGGLWFVRARDDKRLTVFEQLHQESISAALFADSKTLVTASDDCTISVWDVSTSAVDTFDLQIKATLYGHRSLLSVVALAVPLSAIVSCGVNGQVILWDINSLTLIRQLHVDYVISHAGINGATGHILLCSEDHIMLFTINGTRLIEERVCTTSQDTITSCAFASVEWVGDEIVVTGHTGGIVNVWKVTCSTKHGWRLSKTHRLQHPNRPAITAVLPHGATLYCGDDEGRISEWTFK